MAALPAWAPYALFAAGTAAKMKGDSDMEKEQRGILNRAMSETQKTQDKTAAAVAQEGAQYSPEQRAIDMAAQEQGAFQRAQADLAGSEGIVESGTKGAVSGEFLKSKADSAITEGNRITAIAREMAKTRAPGEQLVKEGLRRGNLAGEIGNQWGANRRATQASQLDAQNVDMPGIGQLGQIAQMVGSVWAGGAGAETAATAPTSLGSGAGYVMPVAGGASAAAPMVAGTAAAGTAGSMSPMWGSLMNQPRRRTAQTSMWGGG